MSDLNDMLVRAAGCASVGGAVGARIGGSVTAVFGPAAAGGAATGGLLGSVVCGGASLLSDLFGQGAIEDQVFYTGGEGMSPVLVEAIAALAAAVVREVLEA